MPTLEDIKNFFITNKKSAILLLAAVLFLSISAVLALTLKGKPAQDTENAMSNQEPSSEFVVFDYQEQKLKHQEAKEKAKLEELAVEDVDEEVAPGVENLLAQVPTADNKVTLNIQTSGRSNPFAPYVERSIASGSKFDIVEPPEYIPDEPQAQDLMQTTVSGILYNAQKSSAIINVDGTDQLVNKGDKIAGFQIVNITKNKVYVKKGYNIIAAGVGETIEEPALTYNNVYNLPQKFAGKYSPAKKGVILINGVQQ